MVGGLDVVKLDHASPAVGREEHLNLLRRAAVVAERVVARADVSLTATVDEVGGTSLAELGLVHQEVNRHVLVLAAVLPAVDEDVDRLGGAGRVGGLHVGVAVDQSGAGGVVVHDVLLGAIRVGVVTSYGLWIRK